eukprot:TRINITY_DN68188_c0_g1_i1.p1 TRINITY_DN68188_c0_g1~~TRINITY_DN68188_c0_g1_i1.p1  ORF type:complete len:1039 (+),score=185.35 TRINITY_DN68188_c0_g1_i1:285-3119(+)
MENDTNSISTETSLVMSDFGGSRLNGSVGTDDDDDANDVLGWGENESDGAESKGISIHGFQMGTNWAPDLALSVAAGFLAYALSFRRRPDNARIISRNDDASACGGGIASVAQDPPWASEARNGKIRETSTSTDTSRPKQAPQVDMRGVIGQRTRAIDRQRGPASPRNQPIGSLQEEHVSGRKIEAPSTNHLLETVTRLNSNCGFVGQPQNPPAMPSSSVRTTRATWTAPTLPQSHQIEPQPVKALQSDSESDAADTSVKVSQEESQRNSESPGRVSSPLFPSWSLFSFAGTPTSAESPSGSTDPLVAASQRKTSTQLPWLPRPPGLASPIASSADVEKGAESASFAKSAGLSPGPPLPPVGKERSNLEPVMTAVGADAGTHVGARTIHPPSQAIWGSGFGSFGSLQEAAGTFNQGHEEASVGNQQSVLPQKLTELSDLVELAEDTDQGQKAMPEDDFAEKAAEAVKQPQNFISEDAVVGKAPQTEQVAVARDSGSATAMPVAQRPRKQRQQQQQERQVCGEQKKGRSVKHAIGTGKATALATAAVEKATVADAREDLAAIKMKSNSEDDVENESFPNSAQDMEATLDPKSECPEHAEANGDSGSRGKRSVKQLKSTKQTKREERHANGKSREGRMDSSVAFLRHVAFPIAACVLMFTYNWVGSKEKDETRSHIKSVKENVDEQTKWEGEDHAELVPLSSKMRSMCTPAVPSYIKAAEDVKEAEFNRPRITLYAPCLFTGFKNIVQRHFRSATSWHFVPRRGPAKIGIKHRHEPVIFSNQGILKERQIFSFIEDNILARVGHLDDESIDFYGKRGRGLVVLLPPEDMSVVDADALYRPILWEVANALGNNYYVTFANTKDHAVFFKSNFRNQHMPAVVVQRVAVLGRPFIFKGPFKSEDIIQFAFDVEDGCVDYRPNDLRANFALDWERGADVCDAAPVLGKAM